MDCASNQKRRHSECAANACRDRSQCIANVQKWTFVFQGLGQRAVPEFNSLTKHMHAVCYFACTRLLTCTHGTNQLYTVGQLVCPLVELFAGQAIDWSVGRLVGRSDSRFGLVRRLFGQVGRSVGRPVVRVGRLRRSVGRSVRRSVVRSLGPSVGSVGSDGWSVSRSIGRSIGSVDRTVGQLVGRARGHARPRVM